MKTTKQKHLLRFAGFRVTVDPLLPIVIILIGWLLSERYFPNYTYGYIPSVNYILGGIASVLLTFSILFHELGHALAAVFSKLKIERIHLFLFGGMAELRHRPQTPAQELLIAVSGPLFSFLFAGIFYISGLLIMPGETLLAVVIQFVVQINILLGIFNMIPIFPLDGGRAIRSLYWFIFRKYVTASRATLYTSFSLILVILLAGYLDFLFLNSGYALITIFLGLYLGYTVSKGSAELNHDPKLEDYVHVFEPNSEVSDIIDEIIDAGTYPLSRTIIPVLDNYKLNKVIRGQHLYNAIVHQKSFFDEPNPLVNIELTDLYLDINPGDFIDLKQPQTFDKAVRFSSDYIPLVAGEQFVGLCDANELRFWLMENRQFDEKLFKIDD